MDKIKVSQDTLYEYMTAHDVKMTRLAELIGRTPEVVFSCFKHHKNYHGNPRSFNAEHIALINKALPQVASELRRRLLKFGSSEAYTNSRGVKYDPALVAPMKELGEYLNITGVLTRVCGWTKGKKSAVLTSPASKLYGCISEQDVIAINNEVLSVAAVLGSYEVVVDEE